MNLRMVLKWRFWGALAAIVLMGTMVVLFLYRPDRQIASGADAQAHALAAEGYSGAESCRGCHPSAFESWAHSAHGHAMAVASPETVKGDFGPDAMHVFDGQTYRMFVRNGRYFMEVSNREGKTEVVEAHYVLGARQHQNYLTRFPDGRMQILPVYYDLNKQRWFDAAEGTLEFGKALSPQQFYFWTNHGRTWNAQCFDCHASQMRKNYDLATNTYDTVVGDWRINCESCHGPGAAHVRFWREATLDARTATQEERSLPRLHALPPAKQVETCAQCHALKAVLRSGYVPGDDFQDYYELKTIDAEDAYWSDGLAKKLAYPHLQFVGSACFLKAGLTCTGCHATHGSDRPSDLLADPRGVGLCARCHPDVVADVNAHTRHSPTGPGGNCNACHLPQQFRNELVMTDHRISVPVPENTVRLGIPNACNQSGCHADQSAQWASDWAATWHGEYQAAHVAKTDAIHRGREGDVSAAPRLIEILADGDQAPLLRAGMATLLGKLGAGVPELVSALSDTHSAVRAKAAAALGHIGHPAGLLPLSRALSDSVFSVRIRAAYALAKMDYAPPNEVMKRHYEHALAEFRLMVGNAGLLADDANTHLNVGQIYEFQKAFDKAVEYYGYALRVTPGLAEAQDRMRHLVEAESRYQKLVEMVKPVLDRDARAQVALGLASIHRGQPEGGIALLKRALDAGIRSELVETGLGDGYRMLGRFDEAEAHYRAALGVASGFPGAHRGLAYLLYAKGDGEGGGRHWAQFANGQVDVSRLQQLMGKE